MRKNAFIPALVLIAVGGGAWFYEKQTLDRQATILTAEQARAGRLERRLTELHRQRDEAFRAATAIEHELHSSTPLPAAGPANSLRKDAETKGWFARLRKLKQSFAEFPDQAVPELQLLTDLDWVNLSHDLSLDSDLDLRKARASIRAVAIKRFTPALAAALRAYTDAHGGKLPADVVELIPCFKTPFDPALLQRYQMMPPGDPLGEAIAERSPVDIDFDARHSISTKGRNGYSDSWFEWSFNRAGLQATHEFSAANNGQKPKTGDEVMPYVRDPTAKLVFEAIAQFRKDHPGKPSPYIELRPYVTDPAASSLLEKLIAAAQKPGPP